MSKWRSDDYVWGDEIDEYLVDLGIPQEILERDDELSGQLTLDGGKFLGQDHFEFVDETEQVFEVWGEHDPLGEKLWIADWLDGMSAIEFEHWWENARDEIAALIRCPGGYHEWLMVAALPIIKKMEISISLVKRIVTPTAECQFIIPGTEGEVGCHGGNGSTRMHGLLYACIDKAYHRWQTMPEPDLDELMEGREQNGYQILQDVLRREFIPICYPDDREIAIPESLKALIDEE